ncbi:hypothetical protein [Terribacillus sp. JSM ZJ617]|uniref:hypothetical protein n=1 Tax=Terribacillus sp. JSM ZJ617 TaxID=3342119 RepID=UPI0035A93FD4
MRTKILMLSLLLLLLVPTLATAADSSVPSYFNNNAAFQQGLNHDDDKFLGLTTNSADKYVPTAAFIFNAIFTIMTLLGIIQLGYSLVTKTGFNLKGATGILIYTPLVVVIVRIFFIFVFTTVLPNVTLIINDIISLILAICLSVSVGMVLIGLIMKLFHHFLRHPEYSRWSKRLFVGAAGLTVLSTITPIVMYSI